MGIMENKMETKDYRGYIGVPGHCCAILYSAFPWGSMSMNNTYIGPQCL